MQSMKENSRHCRPALVMLALSWLIAGCADQPDQPLAFGELEYQRFCSTCHGIDGTGRPPTFPPLAGSEWMELGPESVALIVLVGLRGEIEVAGRTYRGYMPPMTQLSDEQIAAVLSYLTEAGWAAWPDLPDVARVAGLREQAESLEVFIGRAPLEAALEELAP
jgi:mono/diheme cytochrome c family protein